MMLSCAYVWCESKVQCCKEQYFIGTWNVRSMNQEKVDMVKQEMARVNINIFGISELNWRGMGKVNIQNTIISTIVGRKPLQKKKKWSSPHSQQMSLTCNI